MSVGLAVPPADPASFNVIGGLVCGGFPVTVKCGAANERGHEESYEQVPTILHARTLEMLDCQVNSVSHEGQRTGVRVFRLAPQIPQENFSVLIKNRPIRVNKTMSIRMPNRPPANFSLGASFRLRRSNKKRAPRKME